MGFDKIGVVHKSSGFLETASLKLPTTGAGLVIGKGRCELNKISQISGADITIDWSSKKLKDFKDFRWFIIKGSKEQVKMAKKIMSEKAAEYKVELQNSGTLQTVYFDMPAYLSGAV